MCELLGNLITYVRELRMATESLRFSFWCVLFHAVTSILAQERLTLSSLLSTQKGRLSSQHVFWRIYKPFIHATDAGETKCHLISPASQILSNRWGPITFWRSAKWCSTMLSQTFTGYEVHCFVLFEFRSRKSFVWICPWSELSMNHNFLKLYVLLFIPDDFTVFK